MLHEILLLCSLLCIAIAFSAVGHGGASGYTAVLLLFAYAPENIRPVVLSMNIIVTLWVLYSFQKREPLNINLFIPLIFISTPAAFLGGSMVINDAAYRILIAVLLLISALRLLIILPANKKQQPHIAAILLAGAILGWLSGLTGIGGGVLLSPLLLLLGWCSMRSSIPVVAGFILINSIAGLAGYYLQHSGQYNILNNIPAIYIWMLLVALIGAISGTYWAKYSARSPTLTRLLAIILIVAGGKMIYTAI